jgi:hypothetical protein
MAKFLKLTGAVTNAWGEEASITISTGAGSAGKIPNLNETGKLDSSFFTSTGGNSSKYTNVSSATGTTLTDALNNISSTGSERVVSATASTVFSLDSGYVLAYTRFTSTSAVTMNIPNDSSNNFPVNGVGIFCRGGSGTVTFVAGSGVTLNCPVTARTLRALNSTCTLIKVAANTYDLIGDLG